MNDEMKKKLDERLVSGEITTDEYKKILDTIESGTSISSNSNQNQGINEARDENFDNLKNKSFNNSTSEKGFLKKLRDGDYGLAKTYWLYGIGFSIIIGIIIQIIFAAMGRSGIVIAFIVILISIIYTAFFQLPGLWRAAKKYQGAKIWAILAQIIVIITAISIPVALIQWLYILANAGF